MPLKNYCGMYYCFCILIVTTTTTLTNPPMTTPDVPDRATTKPAITDVTRDGMSSTV